MNAKSVDHVVKEVSNAIWKAYTRGFITEKDVKKKLDALMMLININILLVDELKLIRDAMNIAVNENITVYDALYIALAEKESIPLVTSDKKQASVCKKRGVIVYYIE